MAARLWTTIIQSLFCSSLPDAAALGELPGKGSPSVTYGLTSSPDWRKVSLDGHCFHVAGHRVRCITAWRNWSGCAFEQHAMTLSIDCNQDVLI